MPVLSVLKRAIVNHESGGLPFLRTTQANGRSGGGLGGLSWLPAGIILQHETHGPPFENDVEVFDFNFYVLHTALLERRVDAEIKITSQVRGFPRAHQATGFFAHFHNRAQPVLLPFREYDAVLSL